MTVLEDLLAGSDGPPAQEVRGKDLFVIVRLRIGEYCFRTSGELAASRNAVHGVRASVLVGSSEIDREIMEPPL